MTFPGELARSITGEGDKGTVLLFQKGFVSGGKIDQITVNDPGLFGGTSDFVALYWDTGTKFAVGFTSCSVCTIPDDFVVSPEPGTWLLFATGFGLLGYTWRRKTLAA